MADIVDKATDDIDATIEAAINKARRIEQPSLHNCKECGEPIPEQRHRLGSVTLCIGCQTELEAKNKHRRA